MSRNARMALYMLGIIVWMGILGLIAYEAGSLAAHSFIGTGVNASLQKWQGLYKPLVFIMASISALISCCRAIRRSSLCCFTSARTLFI